MPLNLNKNVKQTDGGGNAWYTPVPKKPVKKFPSINDYFDRGGYEEPVIPPPQPVNTYVPPNPKGPLPSVSTYVSPQPRDIYEDLNPEAVAAAYSAQLLKNQQRANDKYYYSPTAPGYSTYYPGEPTRNRFGTNNGRTTTYEYIPEYFDRNYLKQFAIWPTQQQQYLQALQFRQENSDMFPGTRPAAQGLGPKAPKLTKQESIMYDYFDRLVLNGRGYSVPNQMLTFADTGGGTYPWPTTTTWYEPPNNWQDPGFQWKETRTLNNHGGGYKEEGTGTTTGAGGGDGGGGGGSWDYDTHPDLGTVSSYYSNYGGSGYKQRPEVGYGAEDTTPWNRYSDQPAIVGYSGSSRRGYGSSNYSSHPDIPAEGYRQDPLTYFQQLVKWVI